ncbi:uncharacterized protein TNCT_668851 [Trichonephila clavata]|uniref:Uncharacterized protein n=1 Tax=Trichonephila clavata TaxID=2740835 RepID=A0A8X6GP30_TRICU|nr:uncharacterized protein TNCT_668851 [Trichonephila clavata]
MLSPKQRNSISITNNVIEHQSAMNSHCSIMSSPNSNPYLPCFMHRIFCWIGFIKETNDKIFYRITSNLFKLILIFVNVDNWVIILRGNDPSYLVHSLTLIGTYVLASGAWYAMYLKRKRFSNLIIKLKELFLTTNKKHGVIFMFNMCCVPVVLTMITIVTHYDNYEYFIYGYKIHINPAVLLVVVFKNILHTFVFPALTNVIALLYCIMCGHISNSIYQLSQDIIKYSPSNFDASKQVKKIKEITHIEEILDAIQNIFSVPTFLIVFANLFTCAHILSLYLKQSNHTVLSYMEWVLYASNAVSCLIAILWIAGGVAIEERKFKDLFHKKAKLRMLLVESPDEPRLERWLFDKPDFVFTGWDIISYRRNTVLAVIGALITYTVLIADK